MSLLRRMMLPRILNPLSNTSTIITCLFSPLSILVDVSQCGSPTYTHGSATLSVVVLGILNVILGVLANALFAWRLYPSGMHNRYSLPLLTASWTLKVAMQVVSVVMNVVQADGKEYAEGFFCTLVSLVLAGLVFISQWIHHIHIEPQSTRSQILIRHFFFQLLLFVLWLFISSITIAVLEHWSHLDSLYFTVVYTLTIGFGDRYPTLTSDKIILFFFATVGIAQIGTLVTIMLKFFQEGANKRRDQLEQFLKRDRVDFPTDLNAEIKQLERLKRRMDRDGLSIEFFLATVAFLAFWILGALLFSKTEEMDFGDALYLCYIIFLTIGFGDRLISSDAGKVVFIIYALVSVPIMTSFVFEVYTQVFGAVSKAVLDDVEDDPDEMHDDRSELSHEVLVDLQRRVLSPLDAGNARDQLTGALEHFEGIARGLLLSTLEGGTERNLLLADRNVRMRRAGVSEDDIQDEPVDLANDVRRYREAYAKLVAVLDSLSTESQARLVDV